MRHWSVWVVCCSVGSHAAVVQPATNDGMLLKVAPLSAARAGTSTQPISPAKIEAIKTGAAELQRLLAMKPEERERALAKKEEDKRSFLRKRLEEYDAMSKEDRETALQGLRVWYYLRDLVKYPAEVRSAALTMIPETDRELVEIRLRRWNKLPPDLQTEVMEHERMFRYVLQLDGLDRAQQEALAHDLPESLREKWDDRLEQWHRLPLERRQQVYGQFHKMFNLSPKERNKVLETLSEQERAQAGRSLLIIQALEKLPLAEQKACIDAFLSFIETPPNSNQRNQRLEELSRWRAYPPDVKASWNSVFKFVPPLPPGLQPPLPGTPQAMQGTANLPIPALPGAANQTTPPPAKSASPPQK